MKKLDLGIVLGFKLKEDGNLTSISKRRLDKAIEFYEGGDVQKILLSGGNTNPKISKTEAQAMYDYLLSKGLPKNSLIKEEKSLDTFGNALFSKELVKRKNSEEK